MGVRTTIAVCICGVLTAASLDLQTERVNVGYSHGGCQKGEEWDVPSGTVTMITVYPQTKVMLSD
jgi:hypothetical protein